MVKDTDSTGGTRRSSRVPGQQRTAAQRTTRAKAGAIPPTRSSQESKKRDKKGTPASTRPPRAPRATKGGRPTSQDEENAAEVLATLPKAQFPGSRQQTQQGLAQNSVGAASSAGKRSSPGRLQQYGGNYAAMANNGAGRASRPEENAGVSGRASRRVENAGVSGSGAAEGGSGEQVAAALRKEAAGRSSSGVVGRTSSRDSRMGPSASGRARTSNRAGSSTGNSVGAGSSKAKPARRTGARKGSRTTSQHPGAPPEPTSEQETPERGTKRHGSSAGTKAADQAASEDTQQPKKKAKKKRKKTHFEESFEAWVHYKRNYDDVEKEIMLAVAIEIGPAFHGKDYHYNNTYGKTKWRNSVGDPIIRKLAQDKDYVKRVDKETVKEVFRSEFGLVKLERWYKSNRDQARKHFQNNPDEGTGASGGKPLTKVQQLRLRLYENHPAINKTDLHESQGGLPEDSSGDEGGGEDERREGDFGGAADTGGSDHGSRRNRVTDARDSAAHMTFDEEERGMDVGGGQEEEEEEEEGEEEEGVEEEGEEEEGGAGGGGAEDKGGEENVSRPRWERGVTPRAPGRPLCPRHKGKEDLKRLSRTNGQKIYYCTGDGESCTFTFREDATGEVIMVDGVRVGDTPARQYEPVTDGGGSSSAGVVVDPLADWPSSGGGGPDDALSMFQSSGGATSAPGGTASKGKGKARAQGTRHVRRGTHGDIDDEMAESASGLAARPAAGGKAKRKAGWTPMGSMGVGNNDTQSVFAGEAKRDEERNAMLAKILEQTAGGQEQDGESVGGGRDADRQLRILEVKLRNDEHAFKKSQALTQNLVMLQQMGKCSKEELRAKIFKDLDPETRRAMREAKEKEDAEREGEGGDGGGEESS